VTALEWVLIAVASASFLALIFFRASRQHWPIVVFIGLIALLGLLVSATGVDLRECQRVGLDCLR
jgi:uncharacterized membrane protein